MKVRIISCSDGATFEEAINMFIVGKRIIDIKYNCLLANNRINDRALILYEDIDNS